MNGVYRKHKKLKQDYFQSGFTLVEVMVSITLIAVLLGVVVSVMQSAMTLNAKALLRSEAGSLAFKKVQDYINLDFDNIPIGDTALSYEVEDFSAEAEVLNLRNVSAKIYVEPESVISSGSTTTTTNYSQSVAADTAFVSGSEINSVAYHDATSVWHRGWRMRDDNYSNYTYSRWAFSPDNLASPSIDLAAPSVVDFIRVDWFACGYGASDFRIEAKNNSPNSNSGWTTIVSGLSDNGISCSTGSHPQDINVSSNTTPYRYWRLFFVNAEDSDYAVVSELEAFSAGSPGDAVEQQGSDASDSPGSLYFSSTDLEMSEDGSRGHQSIGLIFDDINMEQGAAIDDAYLDFTADESDSGPVTLLISAAAVDNASSWSGSYAVDNAVDNDASDGSVGTIAKVTWTPPAWSSGENSSDTRIDVSAIVQEIVNRPGWVSENAMAFAIQYVSGSDKRVAERTPAPELVINWSESVTVVDSGVYVDADSDGDVDNPTLVRITSIITYESFNQMHTVEYSTFVRQFGVGN